MSEALSSLGGIFSGGGGDGGTPNWLKAILGGIAGTGEIGNILADRQRGGVLSDLQKQQKAFQALTPQQLSAKVNQATQPLSTGLTQAVGNLVQGEMGERGLSQAPGIFSAALAQALAPYYQQNQNTALQELMTQWGMPISAAGAEGSLLPGKTDLSGILKLLLSSFNKGGGVDMSGITMGPSPVASGIPMGGMPGDSGADPATGF